MSVRDLRSIGAGLCNGQSKDHLPGSMNLEANRTTAMGCP
jgi:hypothetical protein